MKETQNHDLKKTCFYSIDYDRYQMFVVCVSFFVKLTTEDGLLPEDGIKEHR